MNDCDAAEMCTFDMRCEGYLDCIMVEDDDYASEYDAETESDL